MQLQAQLTELTKGQLFEGYLRVAASEQRTSSNGGKYLDMTLADVSGELNAKLWDGTVAPPPAASIIKVRALLQEYNNRPQLRIDKYRLSDENDDIDMAMLVPCAPLPPQDMLDMLLNRADAIADRELKSLVLMRLEQAGERIMLFPAALRLHHAERSGLLNHTSTMLRAAEALAPIYPQLDADLLAAGIILHDLSKLEEMNADDYGLATEYTVSGQLLGHITMGVSALHDAAQTLGVRRELAQMLEHMLLSHHDLAEYGSPKRPMFPEAEMLHLLDLMDARMYEMGHALAQIKPGEFTERIWSLERRLYRRLLDGVTITSDEV